MYRLIKNRLIDLQANYWRRFRIEGHKLGSEYIDKTSALGHCWSGKIRYNDPCLL